MDSGLRLMIPQGGDRLSVLADDLIVKVLSFVSLKDAMKTSVLSPRWRYTWTLIPHLTLSSNDFSTMDKFSDFVTHVLSRRNNNQAQLSSLNLYLRLKDNGYNNVAHNIMNYAFSHNVQKVNLTCLFGNITCAPKEDIEFSLSLSNSCHNTIKQLKFIRSFEYEHVALTSTSNLSSLTALHLDRITLYDGFFSMCPNLESLTLNSCRMLGSDVFRIRHPRLSNLTVDHGDLLSDVLHVVTPQLKNLTITELGGTYLISAPDLASLLFEGLTPYMFYTDGFPCLEKARLSLYGLDDLGSPDAPKVISLLQHFHNVKDLSLSMEIIELLNLTVELISHQPSPFANLKSLNIVPRFSCRWRFKHSKVIMSAQVKNFLLSSSPEATLTEAPIEHCCESRATPGRTCTNPAKK